MTSSVSGAIVSANLNQDFIYDFILIPWFSRKWSVFHHYNARNYQQIVSNNHGDVASLNIVKVIVGKVKITLSIN